MATTMDNATDEAADAITMANATDVAANATDNMFDSPDIMSPKTMAEIMAEITEADISQVVNAIINDDDDDVVNRKQSVVGDPIPCLCGRNFKTERGYMQHVQTCEGSIVDDQFKCTSCQKILKTAVGLALHKKKDTTTTTYQCTVCKKVCKTKQGLDSHNKACKGPRSLNCDQCNRQFKTPGGASNHRRVCKPPSSTADDYPCKMCSKVFKTKRGHDTHTKYCQMTDDQKHPCPHCTVKLFCTPSAARIHAIRCKLNPQRIVSQKTECEICNKTYTVRGMPTHVRRAHTTDNDKTTAAAAAAIKKAQRLIDSVLNSPSLRMSKSITKKYATIRKSAIHPSSTVRQVQQFFRDNPAMQQHFDIQDFVPQDDKQ